MKNKRVKINGIVAEIGAQVNSGDKVFVDGHLLKEKTSHVYIAFNKPIGVTCTTERHIKGNIIDYINHPERIFPVGRLDKDSEGLILLTSDGSIVNDILREENQHDKEYIVIVNKPINDNFLEKMSRGVKIFNPVKKQMTKTKPCGVTPLGQKSFKIVLSQGLNRQIRRMCTELGYEVVSLKRTRIMHIVIGNIKVGKWRNLSIEELKQIKRT